MLLYKPEYPYQLVNLMPKRLGPSWDTNSGQVYQAIKKLEADGLIELVERAPEGRDDRLVRAITPAGVREFERWFTTGPNKGGHLSRRPVVLKLTLSGPERLEDALLQLDRWEVDCTTRLNEIRALSKAQDPESGVHRLGQIVLLQLSMTADIFTLESELRWAKRARESLKSLMNEDAIWLSPQDGASDPAHLAREGARERLFERMGAPDTGGAAR